MKKQLLISAIALLAMCGANAQTTTTTWNFSDSEFPSGDIGDLQTFRGLSIFGSDAGKFNIDNSSKDIDGFEFKRRLKTGGGGFEDGASDVSPTKRYVSFEVTGNAKITVYGMSSSSSDDRPMIVSDGTQIIAEPVLLGSNPVTKREIEYIGPAATIYLYSRASGINFYAIILEQQVTGIQTIDANKVVKSVDYFDVLGQKVTGQTKGLVIAKTTYEDGTVATKKTYQLEK
jgi:hypothetical protein